MSTKFCVYLFTIFFLSQNIFAQLHFGAPSAVKKKIKQLKDKIEQEKIVKNLPPVIVSLTAEPPVVATGAATTITCVAEDPDNDTLTYSWSAPYGTITGSGHSVTWTAPTYYTPPTGTYYSIFCTVYDTKGASSTANVDVLVTPDGRINRAPVIESLTAEPLSVSTGGVVTIVCTAYDLDGDEIIYSWYTTAGNLVTFISSAILTAPDFHTTVTVVCTVYDSRGAYNSESRNIHVYPIGEINYPPVISSFTAKPVVVSTGATSTITCLAYDPNADTLTYSWNVTGGTITGSGHKVIWQAPNSTGTYTITCIVSDGKGKVAERSINITVIIPWVYISCGGHHTVGIKTDGTLWSWGRNDYGQLGIGNTNHMLTPTQVGTDTDWLYVACGYSHTVAIKKDGTLWSWGNNTRGQLGLGNRINYSTPTKVGTSADWSYVSCGFYHTVGIKTDGTLWSWGANEYGQLGIGNTVHRITPTKVGTDTNWSFVSCGGFHTIAIKTNGTLWSWGLNNYGQLGLGNTTNRTTPAQAGTEKWSYVSCGGYHTIATKINNTLWSWGRNNYGQLGHFDFNNKSTPTQVGAEYNWLWRHISCGDEHSLGIMNDGTLWAWGRNDYGQLGRGDKYLINLPLSISWDTDWTYICCGGLHTVALKKDGTLWCWGANTYGQLGLGDTTERLTPTLMHK